MGHTIIILMTVLLLGQQADNIAVHLEKGREFLAAKKYREAIVEFEKTLKEDPTNCSALYNLERIYGKCLRDEKRRQYYWRRYKAASHVSLAEVAVADDDLREAVSQYKKALEVLPESGHLHEQLGALYKSIGMEAEAVKEYREAAALEPRNLQLQLALWKSLSKNGNEQEAGEFLDRALAIRPGDERLRRKALAFYEKIGRNDKALEQVKALSEGGAASAKEHCRLGALYLKEGRLDEAEREIRRGHSEKTRNDCFRAARELGKAYEERGNPDKAVEVYREMLKGGYRRPVVFNSLSLTYRKKGKLDAAIGVAEEAVSAFPDSAPLHNNLATLYALRTDYGQAVAEYQKAIEIKPDLAGAYLDMGIIYKDYLQDRGKATGAFRRYVELKPDGKMNPEVAELLGLPEGKAPEDILQEKESGVSPEK